MPLMFDSSQSRAILIGIGTFLKDDDLHRREHVYKDISLLRDTLTDTQILGINEKDIISLVDSEGNTMIKERIAEVANTTEDTLFLYYSGYLIHRRGKLILSSPHTTISQCHINGIPLSEVIEIINESNAQRIVLILDAEYRDAPTFGDYEPLTEKSIEELLPFGPKKAYMVSELGQTKSVKTIASELTSLFQTGIDEEREVLTFKDLKNHFKSDAALENVLFSSNEDDLTAICFNKRFSIAKKLRTEIKQKFQEKDFETALPLLKEGIELFENDDEFNNMASFIETLQQADQMFNNQSFDAAKNRYQAAYDIINEDSAYKGLIKSLEKIADEQYDNENYQSSKQTYTELLKYDSSNDLYNDKINYCDNELQFTSYIDLGDKAYFENKFIIAKEHYSNALNYRKDPVVLRRKEECEKFLSREEKLRAELKQELQKEIEEGFDKKIQEEVKNKEHEMKEKLRAQLQDELSSELLPQAKIEATQELETTIWQKTALWNSIEGYQFYLSLFPDGHFIAKANQRMDQIHKQKIAQKMEEKDKKEITKVSDSEKEKKETMSIDRALLMDLRMEPIEDVLVRIEEAQGLKGEILLWTDNERTQLDRNEEENEYIPPTPVQVNTELDDVLSEAIREVEEENGMSFNPTEITEESSDSLSLEEAQEISASVTYLDDETILNSITEEIVELEYDNNEETDTDNSLEQLSDEDLWARSEQINTKDAYLEYINYTKTADQIAEAYYRINKIDQGETPQVISPPIKEVSDETTPSNDISQSPEFEVAPINNQFIEGMDEETLWKTAHGINTIDSYKEYLNRTLSNDYLADAYSNINTLQNEERIENPQEENIENPIDLLEETTVDDTLETSNEEEIIENVSDLEIDTNALSTEEQPSSLNGFEASDLPSTIEKSNQEEVKIEVLDHVLSTNSEEDILELNEDEEDLWKNTCEENTLGAYFNYLNLTTQKKYWKEAKEQISALKNDSQAKEEDDWKKAQEIDTVEGYKTYIRKYPLGNYYAAAMMRLGKLE